MSGFAFTWKGGDLIKQIRDNVEEALHGAAVDAAKAASDNAAVDTGFLRGSTYAKSKRGSTGMTQGVDTRLWSPKQKRMVRRRSVAAPPLGDATAMFGASAIYAIFAEVKAKPFLYPAAETLPEAIKARLKAL